MRSEALMSEARRFSAHLFCFPRRGDYYPAGDCMIVILIVEWAIGKRETKSEVFDASWRGGGRGGKLLHKWCSVARGALRSVAFDLVAAGGGAHFELS